MKKRKLTVYQVLSLVTALVTILGFLVCSLAETLARDWLVVALGIRTFNSLRIAAMITTGVSLVLTVVLSIPTFRDSCKQIQEQRRQKEVEAEKKRVVSSYTEEGATPENTREILLQLSSISLDFKYVVGMCIGQMNTMDKLQERQYDLISSNGAAYLEETRNVLDRVEKRICGNIWSVRNLCIAAGDARRLDSDKVQMYLDDNQAKLKDSERLLDVSVDWINQYDQDGKTDLGEVNLWIKTIEKSLKEDIDK